MNSFNSQTSSSASGHKILPIFNMRKRPRQALYAVPSSQEIRNKEEVVSLTINHENQPMNPQSQSFVQYNQTRNASAQFKGNWNKPSSSFDSSSKTFKQPTGIRPKTQLKNTNQSQTRKLPPMQLLPNNNKANSTKSQWSRDQSSTPRTAVAHKSSVQSFQKQPKLTKLENPSYSYHTSKETSFQSNVSHNVFQERISTTTPHEAQSTSDMTRNKVMQPKETMGSSLRVLTLGVEGVKKWSQILSDGMLLFEVFGLLKSEVTYNSEKSAKQFTVKDGNHTMQCIFYETDRVMPHLKRGQWIRCVGIFQNNITIFQCVSVREVSPNEQRWMKAQMGACEKVIKSHASIVKMEP
ncbi:uncharacterized protein [Apostichopus japonicus]|uniref:uncharacterized protein isoform X1 n=2 Tax=Stichopus japonicus TaxID=307972 RepID=UPI003AB84CF3